MVAADFGLAQLAQSGSRLKSVLLYHMMPGGAFTLDQLASAGNVTTLLGQDLNASYPLQWGKNSTGDVSSSPCRYHSGTPCSQDCKSCLRGISSCVSAPDAINPVHARLCPEGPRNVAVVPSNLISAIIKSRTSCVGLTLQCCLPGLVFSSAWSHE